MIPKFCYMVLWLLNQYEIFKIKISVKKFPFSEQFEIPLTLLLQLEGSSQMLSQFIATFLEVTEKVAKSSTTLYLNR